MARCWAYEADGPGGRAIRFARWASGYWQIEELPESSQGQLGRMRLDDLGRPVVAFVRQDPGSGTGAATLATLADGSWSLETVPPTEGGVLVGLDLLLAPDGQPHLAYVDLQDFTVMYATRTAGTWTAEQVAELPLVVEPRPLSLALDNAGRPRIAFTDFPTEVDPAQLTCATREPSGWTLESVDADGHTGFTPFMTLGPEGRLHVAYFEQLDAAQHRLLLATELEGGWDRETVTELLMPGFMPFVAFDPTGQLLLTHHEAFLGDLQRSHRTADGRWRSEVLDPLGMIGARSALACNGDLRYLRLAPQPQR